MEFYMSLLENEYERYKALPNKTDTGKISELTAIIEAFIKKEKQDRENQELLTRENKNSGKIIDALRKTAEGRKEENDNLNLEWKGVYNENTKARHELEKLEKQHNEALRHWEHEKKKYKINEEHHLELLAHYNNKPKETELTYLRRIVENFSRCIKE